APASVTEKLIISKVGDDVSLLKPGTEVRTIGGRPWQESLQEAVRFTSGSTDRMRRNQAAKWLLPFILGTKETFKDLPIEGILNGQVVKENISRVLTLSDGNAEPPPAATGKGSINARIINGNIGYLRIDAFMGTKMDILLDQAMSRLLHTEGLLIDVRLNGGGTPVGDRVLSYLIEQEIMRYSAKIRNSDMLMAMQPLYATGFDFINGNWSEVWQYKVQPNAHGKYKKPVVVLTSAYCFSACDTFVSALKENNLAKVAGEATGGGTGSPVVFNLPYSKFKFRYSVQKGYKAVSGDLLEGVGTGVDLDISPTAQERIAEKDEQLKTAVAYLKSLMTDQPTLQFHLNSVAEENSEFERAADRQPLRSPLLEMESEILKSNFEN
ncbi:MAG TPA: S41 family peptidase, partial [Pseudobdellovibrionaceae bacterium]